MHILFNLVFVFLLFLFPSCIESECCQKNENKSMSNEFRKAEYEINPLILNRYATHAMSGESITTKELMSLFEAAKWAPSGYNYQPWRFIYAMRNTPEWDNLFNLLVPFNQDWAKNAAALVVVISKNNYDDGSKNQAHSFEAGMAFENLLLQASAQDLTVHPIGGFDYESARKELNIPNDYTIDAMAAIGKLGDKKSMDEPLQRRESVSTRNPIEEIVFVGRFK